MKLAIDTSTRRALLALDDDGERIVRRFEPRATQKVIFAELAAMLDPDTLAMLDGIIVGIGPGSFTGVKIGVMAAKALAWSRAIPLIGVGSLDAVAAATTIPEKAEASLVVAVPSTRGEAYVRMYEVAEHSWRSIGPIHDIPLDLDELNSILPPGLLMVSGEAAEEVARALKGKRDFVLAIEETRYPDAEGMFALAEKRFTEDDLDDPMTLVPAYVRLTQPERRAEGGKP